MKSSIPTFGSVEEESDFWDKTDAGEYFVGPEVRVQVSPELRQVIPLRLAEEELEEVRRLARERKIGVQHLLHSWLSERLATESLISSTS